MARARQKTETDGPATNSVACLQNFIYNLAPKGMAGFVFANGSMTYNQSSEGDIRRALIEANLVACMVSLPIFGDI